MRVAKSAMVLWHPLASLPLPFRGQVPPMGFQLGDQHAIVVSPPDDVLQVLGLADRLAEPLIVSRIQEFKAIAQLLGVDSEFMQSRFVLVPGRSSLEGEDLCDFLLQVPGTDTEETFKLQFLTHLGKQRGSRPAHSSGFGKLTQHGFERSLVGLRHLFEHLSATAGLFKFEDLQQVLVSGAQDR